jgi:hypothetical protein
LVERYRDEIVPTKKGHEVEGYILKAFLRDPLARRKLSDLRLSDCIACRDRRLRAMTGKSISRELSPLRNMFTIARDQWELPLRGKSAEPTETRDASGLKVRLLKRGLAVVASGICTGTRM